MRAKDLRIARRFAPVICQETAGGPDERYQDYFCRVDYDGDRQANNNWDNLDAFRHRLLPEVYFSLTETRTHYFILYSVYHPRDWKPIEGHENDMEHAQVVVRKRGSSGVVQYLYTNAHIWYHAYYNDEDADVASVISDLPARERRALFEGRVTLLDGAHPVIHVEPGSGDLLELLGEVGHGIRGVSDRPGSRWKPSTASFDFEDGQGLVCFPSDEPGGAPDPDQEVHAQVKYGLIPSEDTLWSWRQEVGHAGLFSLRSARWDADGRSYRSSQRSRRSYLEELGLPTLASFPEAFVGNDGRPNAAHPPFAFELGVPYWRYLWMAGRDENWISDQRRHNPLIDIGRKSFDNFFDPAHAWWLRLAGPPADAFSLDYVHNPYLGIA